jgi:RNA polymerase sigma factor (sigma-70 family)
VTSLLVGAEPLRFAVVTSPSNAELLAGVSKGDGAAWRQLVDRYSGLIWSVARGTCHDQSAAADVSQTVWLRLAEHVDRIREPDRLGSWLATTARHEAIRVSKLSRRVQPSDDVALEVDATAPLPGERMEDAEIAGAVRQAFDRLGERCRELLRLLTAEPRLDYQTISAMTGRPIGSLGPTRARCLEQLRALLAGTAGGEA